ncbi:carbonic anhydrase [Dissoconium aciculare CBS 342.82]|uniref:Carbonic anhydrase n=1 Tax=Dissoconium aciculare CBS 342.82 TaxID=1314786 RepID=A0A6J3MEW1_9PEZI|nr:carbonic anhydrase [Dissoconium aciculare CBS 342.82]KAF1826541.1 carbonic anhydrase [Dissoconium aciculare CBS 342.82]
MSGTAIQQNISASSEKYSSEFTKGNLALPPAKKYLVVTCMDARIDPAAAFGIDLGDAHVIRNAGGNAKDALRSILISQHLLGTREIILVKHTDCGMLTFTNADALQVVAGNVGAGVLTSTFDFQPFPDLQQGVKDDVAWLKSHSALVRDIEISGWVYDVRTGKTTQVV